MICEKCGKEKDGIFIQSEVGSICEDCFDKSLGIFKCKVCGNEFSKWRWCLHCGAINHRYTNKNYIGEGETDYCQDYLHVEGDGE